MSPASIFTEIGSIEHEINYSEEDDDIVDDVFMETEGSLEIYITTSQQWVNTENNHNACHHASFLGKIQSPATEVFSTKIQFVDLIDLVSVQFTDLQSVVDEVIRSFNINPDESFYLLKDITSIINKSAKEIEVQKPKEFEIEIFIEIVAKEVCSKREFGRKYGELFRGETSAMFMRSKRFLEEEAACCNICALEFMPGVDEVVVMPCADMFHKMCVGRWLNERSNICPACYWSPATSELPKSSSGLHLAKQMFDRIQDIVN